MIKELISYSDSIVIDADADKVYQVISEIENMGKFSPVCKECRWETDNHGEGGYFTGKNITPERTWETKSQVSAAIPGKEFSFIVGDNNVKWSYKLLADNGKTVLTEEWIVLPGWEQYYKERFGTDADIAKVLEERLATTKTGIRDTLAAIKSYIEPK